MRLREARLRVTGWGPFPWPGERKVLNEAAEETSREFAVLGLDLPSALSAPIAVPSPLATSDVVPQPSPSSDYYALDLSDNVAVPRLKPAVMKGNGATFLPRELTKSSVSFTMVRRDAKKGRILSGLRKPSVAGRKTPKAPRA
jgi:hypothetical protein